MSLKTSVSRARHTMHRRGVLGTTVRAAEMAAMLVYWTEAHKWLALDVHGERPHFALADGLVLDRGSLADFALIEPLGYVLEEVEEHLDAGGEL